MEDAVLVEAAVEGDKQAFAQIYDRYADRVYSFLVTVLRDREEAADVLQDTFLTAGARLDQLREPAKLRSWLFAIARNGAMKSISRRGRHDPLDDFDVADQAAGPAEVLAQAELAQLIAAAADGLGNQERMVFDLYLRQGIEGQELAEAIGVKPGHAYVLMARMKDQVERSLGALLVARQGKQDCPELQSVLKNWDGRLSALWRKRVARHVDGCQICSSVRERALSSVKMAGVLPFLPAPAHAREAVLEQLQLVGHTGRPWPQDRGGFPPGQGNRRRTGIIAAVLAALLLFPALGRVMAGGVPSSPVPAASEVPLVFDTSLLGRPAGLVDPEPSPGELVEPKATSNPVATVTGRGVIVPGSRASASPTRSPAAPPSTSTTAQQGSGQEVDPTTTVSTTRPPVSTTVSTTRPAVSTTMPTTRPPATTTTRRSGVLVPPTTTTRRLGVLVPPTTTTRRPIL
ncbi:MAG: sigma-70 family RNA polymerase sigma factor [Actinomycetota bacterium]